MMLIEQTDSKTVQLSQATPGPEPLAHSVSETCILLGLSRGTVYQLVHSGQLRSVRIGRRIVIPRVAIKEILEKR